MVERNVKSPNSWYEIIPGLAWGLDDVFSDSLVQSWLDAATSTSDSTIRSSQLEEPKFLYTEYHYNHVKTCPNLAKKIFNSICIELNSQLVQIGQPKIDTLKEVKASSLFCKSFEKDSLYALHTEDPKIFGPIAYVFYLQSETSAPLIFPSKNDVEVVFPKSQIEDWRTIEKYLAEEGRPAMYSTETVKCYPKKNSVVMFKTGLAHGVLRYESKGPGRFCLTGFPYARIN